MNENGVIDHLEATKPKQFLFKKQKKELNAKIESRKNNLLQPWIRPTINWDLECEWSGQTRQHAYGAFATKVDQLGKTKDIAYFGLVLINLLWMQFAITFFALYCCGIEKITVVLIFLHILAFYLFIRLWFGIVFVAYTNLIFEELEKLDTLITKIEDLASINKCVDVYSRIDEQKMLGEL